ncbi:MAG: CxxC-x17-CxxC domain-containing protein [Nanoarchaeota archaeon]
MQGEDRFGRQSGGFRNREGGRPREGGFRREGGFGNRGFGGPKEMHKATCSDCGKETEVPFKPTEGRPVFCKDCYQNHKKF